jgi:hypothetical protein
VRELIDRIAYPTDPRWTIDAYDARERLRVMGPAAYTGLEKIIADKNENLRIRRQAILVYTQMLSAGGGTALVVDKDTLKHAIKLIRHQRWWDRNPEIRSMARECLARLKRLK